MRLSRAALVPGMFLAIAGSGQISGTAASAAATSFTVTSGYTGVVKLGPNADTSCDVNYDLYVPSGASAQHPVPAILTSNGFGGSKADQAGEAGLWAARGYVVLSYSGLGFGGSSCLVYTDDPDWDGRAASQLIDFLGRQPAVLKDGRGPVVGTWGGSYGGGFQFALASVDTRVRAMIPEITWNDLAYSLLPNNDTATLTYGNSPAGVEKLGWVSLFYGLGNAEAALNPGHSGWTNTDGSGRPFNGTPPNPACPGYEKSICENETISLAQGYGTQAVVDRLHHASAQYELFNKYPAGSLHFPPTMLLQGQADTLFNVGDAAANYRGFKSKGAPVKLVIKEGGHSGPAAPGEYNNSDPSRGYLTQEELNWFDHYLKHTGVRTGPEVEYFRDWVPYNTGGSAQAAYASAPSWPVGRVEDLYLSGGNALVTSTQAVQAGTASFTNTLPPGPASYSETSAVQGSGPTAQLPPYDPPGTFAAYSTTPLARAIDSVGIPSIDVHIADDNPTSGIDPALNVVIFAKIYDIAPDGTVTLVHRIVAPVRDADTSKAVHINLPGVVHRYEVGHRLRLVLASTDSAYAGSRATHALSITVDPAHPTALHLPVVASAQFGPALAVSSGPSATARQGSLATAPAAAATAAAAAPAAGAPRAAGLVPRTTYPAFAQASVMGPRLSLAGAGAMTLIVLLAAASYRRRHHPLG